MLKISARELVLALLKGYKHPDGVSATWSSVAALSPGDLTDIKLEVGYKSVTFRFRCNGDELRDIEVRTDETRIKSDLDATIERQGRIIQKQNKEIEELHKKLLIIRQQTYFD